MNTAKNATVSCSVLTRPIRSASTPATQPPIAEATSVAPPTSPACVRLIDHSAMIAGITRLNICTSRESSAHPPKHAQNVRRSLPEISLNHPNIACLLIAPRRVKLAVVHLIGTCVPDAMFLVVLRVPVVERISV